MRRRWKEYAWVVYPLNAWVAGMSSLLELSRTGHGTLVELLAAKDALVAGLAVVVISRRWREIWTAPGDGDEMPVAGDGISGEGGLSLGGYALPPSSWVRQLGVWGRLPTGLLQAILLSPMVDLIGVIIVRKP